MNGSELIKIGLSPCSRKLLAKPMNIIRARIFSGKCGVGKYWFVNLDVITIQITEILRYFLRIRIGNNCKRYIHGGFYQRRDFHNLGNQNFLGKRSHTHGYKGRRTSREKKHKREKRRCTARGEEKGELKREKD